MQIDIETVEVKVKIIENQKLKAIIGLDCEDFVVKGFRVMESEYDNSRGDKLWLTPPSYQGGSRWHPIFFMPDKTRWEALQERIWDAYYNKLEEHYNKRFELDKQD